MTRARMMQGPRTMFAVIVAKYGILPASRRLIRGKICKNVCVKVDDAFSSCRLKENSGSLD